MKQQFEECRVKVGQELDPQSALVIIRIERKPPLEFGANVIAARLGTAVQELIRGFGVAPKTRI